MKNVIVVTNIPNPYRVPLFNSLNEQLKLVGYSLTVVFAAEGYARRKFVLDKSDMKFNYLFLHSAAFQLGDEEKTVFSYAGLKKVLKDINPDVIISPGFSPATMRVILFSYFRKTKVILWSGSLNPESAGMSLLRKIQRKVLIKFVDATIAYGTKARKYLINLGAKEKSAFIATNTVDTSFFETETAKLRKEKDQNQIKHLLYVGYLSPRKNVSLLLEAIKKIANRRNDFVLDILGDGEEKTLLENKVQQMELVGKVIFHGFKQKSELPEYYAQSSAFLFQTDFDIWGLVLNEAMAAGVPCIVSPNAGAAADLIVEGETGFVCNYSDIDSVVAKIEYLLDRPKEVERIGENARMYIRNNATLEISASGFVKAVLSTNK